MSILSLIYTYIFEWIISIGKKANSLLIGEHFATKLYIFTRLQYAMFQQLKLNIITS